MTPKEKTFIHVANPTLRFWNYVKFDLGLEVREVFNEQKRLVTLDVNVSDYLDFGVTPEELIAEFKTRQHFTKNGAKFSLLHETGGEPA